MTDTEHKPLEVDRFAFYQKHPFVLSDGRRFCSLEVAAASAAGMLNATVTDSQGHVYTQAECQRIMRRDRRPVMPDA